MVDFSRGRLYITCVMKESLCLHRIIDIGIERRMEETHYDGEIVIYF